MRPIPNDYAIEILENLGNRTMALENCARQIVALAEDAVHLHSLDSEGCEVWMIDGDHRDAYVVLLNSDVAAEALPFNSCDWGSEFREKIIVAKDAYYDSLAGAAATETRTMPTNHEKLATLENTRDYCDEQINELKYPTEG
jgi:hypothetical protein